MLLIAPMDRLIVLEAKNHGDGGTAPITPD